MKKIFFLSTLAVTILVLQGCTSKTESTETTEIIRESVSIINESSDELMISNESEVLSMLDEFTQNEIENEKFLTEFATEFLNFESIDSRNEILKNKMTAQSFDENGMGIKANADYQSAGEVLSVYKSLSKKNTYYIDTIAFSKNQEMGVAIYVELVEEGVGNIKVSKLRAI